MEQTQNPRTPSRSNSSQNAMMDNRNLPASDCITSGTAPKFGLLFVDPPSYRAVVEGIMPFFLLIGCRFWQWNLTNSKTSFQSQNWCTVGQTEENNVGTQKPCIIDRMKDELYEMVVWMKELDFGELLSFLFIMMFLNQIDPLIHCTPSLVAKPTSSSHKGSRQ